MLLLLGLFLRPALAFWIVVGVPVAFAGGMIAVAVMGVDMNTAVWVGFIALFGIAAIAGSLWLGSGEWRASMQAAAIEAETTAARNLLLDNLSALRDRLQQIDEWAGLAAVA